MPVVIIFILSYWLYYMSRIALSYLEIYISMTVFNLGFVMLSLVLLGLSMSKSENGFKLDNNHTLLFFSGIFVLAMFLPSIISTGGYGISLGIYFIAVFPVIFLIISLLLPKSSCNEVCRYANKWYLYVFAINFVVGMVQFIGTQTGLISLEVFFHNEYLQAIIFPGIGVAEDRLRVPGLFSNAGVNGYFNSLLVVYFISKWGKIRFDLKSALLLMMALFTIYITLTRKVWLAIIIVGIVFILMEIKHSNDIFKRTVHTGVLFLIALLVVFGSLYIFANLDSSQAFSTHSAKERFYEWGYYLDLFSNSSWYSILFGFGILQAFFQETILFYPVLIDNVFLALLVYSGIVGLVSYSIFWLAIGMILAQNYNQFKFGFLIWVFFSVVSLFSTFFADISTVMFAMSVFSIVLSYESLNEYK